mgnify:FL=1
MDRKSIARLILFHPFFVLTLLVVILNELISNDCKSRFFVYYLNDLLAPIVILTFTSLFLSQFLKEIYRLSKKQLFFFFVYLSFTFEYFLPHIAQEYTSDKFDVVAYGLGTLLYHNLINKNELKRSHRKKT